MRLVAILVITAGCLSKPPRPEGDAGVPPDGNSGPACVRPPVTDTFDNAAAEPCGDGAEDQDANSTVARNGVLSMTVAANLVNDASCTWNMSFEDGAFVEVRKTLGPGGTFTILQVDIGDLRVGVQVIDETTAILEMFDTILPGETVVQLPYDPREMRWWRLRPDGGQVIGEYSRDGTAWTRLGASTSPAPGGITQVSLNAGAYQGIASPGRAELDNFNVCPP